MMVVVVVVVGGGFVCFSASEQRVVERQDCALDGGCAEDVVLVDIYGQVVWNVAAARTTEVVSMLSDSMGGLSIASRMPVDTTLLGLGSDAMETE